MTCSLCYAQPKTVAHITTECNYAEALWDKVSTQFGLPSYGTMPQSREPVEWVTHILQSGSKKEKREKLGILFAFWWNVWKEPNRRIFNNYEHWINHVARNINEDLALLYLAMDGLNDPNEDS